jgi:signal transduction histidine kinase
LLEDGVLVLQATSPPIPDDFPDSLRRTPLEDHPFLQRAIDEKEPLLIPDALDVELTPAGQAAVASRDLRTLLHIPLVVHARELGVFIVGSMGEPTRVTDRDIGRVAMLSELAGLTLVNASLFASGQLHAAQLEEALVRSSRAEAALLESRDSLRLLSRKLEGAIETERARVARDLHDDLGQALTAIKMDLDRLGEDISSSKENQLEAIQRLRTMVAEASDRVQKVAVGLRPAILDVLGVASAVEWYLEELRSRVGFQIRCRIEVEENGIPSELGTTIFRVLQEGITNVVRHAEASLLVVELTETTETVRIAILDDGKGISEKEIESPHSIGLVGLRERLLSWNGEMSLSRRAPSGTQLTITIPKPDRDLLS